MIEAMDKTRKTLSQCESSALAIAQEIMKRQFVRPQDEPEPVIVGVAKGGIWPAMRVAQHLGYQCTIIPAKRHDGHVILPRSTEIEETLYNLHPSRLIFVDDILDSGVTFERFFNLIPEMRGWYTLFGKPGAHSVSIRQNRAVWYPEVVRAKTWIVFPWELE